MTSISRALTTRIKVCSSSTLPRSTAAPVAAGAISSATMLCPAALSDRPIFEPMRPVPPVIRTFRAGSQRIEDDERLPELDQGRILGQKSGDASWTFGFDGVHQFHHFDD